MTDHLDPVLLAKWLAGQLTSDERQAIDRWLAADLSRSAALEELREVWSRAGEVAEARAVGAEENAAESARWSAIQRTIQNRENTSRRSSPGRTIEFPLSHRRSRVRRWWIAAAAGAVLAFGGAMWEVVRDRAAAVREFVVAKGVPQTVVLSDGSAVTLAAGTRLTFVDGRGPGSHRTATLDGQAFFVVAHDARHPFIVTAGPLTTSVLGTEFSVRAYAGESPSVVLRSGKVRVAHSRSPVRTEAILVPGHEARLDARDMIQVDTVDLDRALAWTSGRLEFVGAELASVLQEVNRWYGLRLRLADGSRAQSRVTVTFEQATANDVIATLTRLLGPGVLTSSPLPGSR